MGKYIDAERYINNLRELRTGDKDTVYEYYDDGIDVAISEAAIFPAVDIPRWIPVTERLPAYGEEVLLSTNGDCRIGYLVPTYDERQYEWHHLGFFYFFNEVDAWMPLPEPYKEGEQNG